MCAAVVVGAADVAETVLRAQGSVAGSAIDAVFTVATVATRGGDVQAALSRERGEVRARADAGRADVGDSWSRARQEIRGAVKDYDVAVEALTTAEHAAGGPGNAVLQEAGRVDARVPGDGGVEGPGTDHAATPVRRSATGNAGPRSAGHTGFARILDRQR